MSKPLPKIPRSDYWQRLRKQCPYLVPETSLRAALGRKGDIPKGRKVVLILDQFEQYLHATLAERQQALIDALLECDGARLQCVLMVRDDFITADHSVYQPAGNPALTTRELCHRPSIRPASRQKGVGVVRPGLRGRGQVRRGTRGSGHVSQSGHCGIGRGRRSHLRAAGVVCADDQRQELDARDVEKKLAGHRVWAKRSWRVHLTQNPPRWKTAGIARARRRRKCCRRCCRNQVRLSKGSMRSRDALLEVSGYAQRPQEFDDLIRILDTRHPADHTHRPRGRGRN